MAPCLVEKQDCGIKLIWYLNNLYKVPIFSYNAYQIKERIVCILLRLLKMTVNEILCKRTPYFRSFFFLRPSITKERVVVKGALYMHFLDTKLICFEIIVWIRSLQCSYFNLFLWGV